jgi:triose/dihydroxyacetone kinase / FAD-AMP lyase (cyclizing)
MLVSTSDPERSFGNFVGDGEDKVVLMVNNLGGLSELELGGISREALSSLNRRKIKTLRVLVGSFMVNYKSKSEIHQTNVD